MNQGDYQVIRAKDNEAIEPSEFTKTVQPGMKFEMSIVMRRTMAVATRCPRCYYMNSQLAENRGWIQW